jgi:hypothetical protein
MMVEELDDVLLPLLSPWSSVASSAARRRRQLVSWSPQPLSVSLIWNCLALVVGRVQLT